MGLHNRYENYFSEIRQQLDNTTDITEQKLIEKYQHSKGQDHIAALYEPYMPMVYGTCLKYLKSTTDAQDAMMTIYEIVSKKLKTHKVDNFKPWLYVVTKNYCFDELRKKNRRLDKKKVAENMYSEQVFHPDSVGSNKEKLLHNCIEKLSAKQKYIIKAFYFDKMSYQQIADSNNIEWSTIRSKIQNGRRMLKKCIEKNASK